MTRSDTTISYERPFFSTNYTLKNHTIQQDYYYLVQTILQRASVLGTSLPGPEDIFLTNISDTVSSMRGDVEFATLFKKNLTDELGIDERVIDSGNFHAAGLGYAKWLQTTTELGWFAFQVSRIACVYVRSFVFVTLPNLYSDTFDPLTSGLGRARKQSEELCQY